MALCFRAGGVRQAGLGLILAVVLSPVRADEPKTAGESAYDVMRKAHKARAVWEDFPGFTADIVVRTDGLVSKGTIEVSQDFRWKLQLDTKPHESWLDAKLRSVILHRRPSEMSQAGFSFVEGSGAGRLVANNDGSGVFRIENGVILEVLRKTEKNWFEISNLELFETPDGRNLPEASAVVYRDPKSGDIQEHRSNIFKWTQGGKFNLPKRCLTVEVGPAGQRSVREVVFSNHRLK